MSGAQLEDLIAPLTVDDLVQNYWQRHFYLARARPEWVFGELAPQAVVEELIATLPLPADSWFSIIDLHPLPFESALFGPDQTIDLPSLYRVYASGRTLLLRRLHRRRSCIGLLCRNVELRLVDSGVLLGDRVGANLYMTPPARRGLAVHYDDHDVLVIQLGGSKTWRLYDRVVEAASGPTGVQLQRSALPSPLAEPTLSAGDVLYLPAGFPHEAWTDKEESIHLTLSLRPATVRDLLIAATGRCADLRRPLPPHPTSRESAQGIASVLRSLTDDLETSGLLKDAIGDLEERLTKRLGVIPDRGLADVSRLSEIDTDSLVEVRPGVAGLHRPDREGDVWLLPGRRIQCPVELTPALESIFAGGRLRVGDLPRLDEADQRQFVRELILAGVLRVVDEPVRVEA